MVISVKKRNKHLTWTYGKFILCAENKLCFACALKNANDGTLAICSQLLDTWIYRVFEILIWFWVQIVNRGGNKLLV